MNLFEIALKNGQKLRIYRSIYAPVNSNMFIILQGHEALVIDPNVNEEVIELFTLYNIDKVYIILTHEHYDHTSGVIWLQERYECKLICNKKCAEIISVQNNNNPMLVAFVLADKDKKDRGTRYIDFKKSFMPYSLRTDKIYETPCEFNLMGLNFKGFQTPGHSPGSWCLTVNDSLIITGDTLIKDTPVVLRFMESRKQDYMNISLPFLKSLDENLYVLPGHFDPFILKDNNILDTYNV